VTFGVKIDSLYSSTGVKLLAPVGGDNLAGTIEGRASALAFCPTSTYSSTSCTTISSTEDSTTGDIAPAKAPPFDLHGANAGNAFVFALSSDWNGTALSDPTTGDAPSAPVIVDYGIDLNPLSPGQGAPGTTVTLDGDGFGPVGTALMVNFCPGTDDHPDCIAAPAPGGGPPTVASNGTLTVVAPTPPSGSSGMDVYVDVPSPSPGGIPLASTADQGGVPFIYIGAPPSCGTLQNCQGSTNTTSSGSAIATSATSTGAITTTGSGIGSLTVGRYGTNPVGAATFNAAGSYFDVAAGTPNGFASVTIADCDMGPGNALQWWNPTGGTGIGAWQLVSSQTYGPGPPACVTATLTSTTSPSIAQLTGTVFASAENQSINVRAAGALNFSLSGVISSSGFTINPPTWPPTSITGRVGISDGSGGIATVSFGLYRFLSLYLGTISITDPTTGLNVTAVINPLSVRRVGTHGLTGTAIGAVPSKRRLAPFTLSWTVTW
jgi:hypothetical protein